MSNLKLKFGGSVSFQIGLLSKWSCEQNDKLCPDWVKVLGHDHFSSIWKHPWHCGCKMKFIYIRDGVWFAPLAIQHVLLESCSATCSESQWPQTQKHGRHGIKNLFHFFQLNPRDGWHSRVSPCWQTIKTKLGYSTYPRPSTKVRSWITELMQSPTETDPASTQ